MKKIVFLTAGLIMMFLYACSNDQEGTTMNDVDNREFVTKSGSAATKHYYNVMINSSSYITARNSMTTFVGKMNFSGTISQVDTEAKMLSWINTNLSQTSFASYNAAVSEWNTVKSHSQASVSNNMNFFSNLRNESDPAGVYFDLIEVDAPTGDDPCDCQATFVTGMNAISTTYAASIYNALTGPSQNMQQSYDTAVSVFTIGTDILEMHLLNCIIDCPF